MDHSNIHDSAYVKFHYTKGERQDRSFIVLPGVLARGSEQIAPVRSVLEGSGDILAVSYLGDEWLPESIAYSVAKTIKEAASNSERFTIIGVSVGAYLAPLIVDYLPGDLQKRTDVIVIDGPYGPDTLTPVPGWTYRLIRAGVMSWPGNALGNVILDKSLRLPKRENIETDSDLAFSEAMKYKDKVIAKARYNLSNHSWLLYAGQVRYMVEKEPYVSLLAKHNIHTVYVACLSAKNDTVKQPLAEARWRRMLLRMTSYEVDSAHASFLEASRTWKREIAHIINL